MKIGEIKEKVRKSEYETSSHAEEERGNEKISNDEIEGAILKGEVIEDYPDDARGPSCLILGWIRKRTPLHIVCGLTSTGWVRIITVYIPTKDKWGDNFRKRRR